MTLSKFVCNGLLLGGLCFGWFVSVNAAFEYGTREGVRKILVEEERGEYQLNKKSGRIEFVELKVNNEN